MKNMTAELKVGIFAMAIIAILAFMTFKISDFQWARKKGYVVYINFRNIAGLDEKTKVKIAGVDAGIIENISLRDGVARLKVRVSPGERLYSDASAAIKATGLLGDKFLAINIGSSEPLLKNGDTIKNVREVVDIDDMARNLSDVSVSISRLANNLNEPLGSEEAKQALKESILNLRTITTNINSAIVSNDKRLSNVLTSINELTASIRDLVQGNKDSLNATVNNVRDFSGSLKAEGPQLISNLNKATKELREIIEENKSSVKGTIDSMESITRKIESGEGTIGKLVRDDRLYESLNKATEGVNKALSSIDRFRTYITFQGEYLAGPQDGKGSFYLTLQPRPEKYYILGVVSSPAGRVSTTDTTITTNGVTTIEKREEVKKKIEFTAQFARRFTESPVLKDTVLRGGVTQNTFGVGVDQFFMKDKLKVSVDAWDFEHSEAGAKSPHLKAGADYFIFKNVFISGGVDNILNSRQQGAYAGGGIRFEDEDFKYLMGSMPKITTQ